MGGVCDAPFAGATERGDREARSSPVSVHGVARPRRARSSDAASAVHETCQGYDATGRRTDRRPLQVSESVTSTSVQQRSHDRRSLGGVCVPDGHVRVSFLLAGTVQADRTC